MSKYEDLSRDQLEERLRLAEDVCLLYTWSASTMGPKETDRQKATHELWSLWWKHPGVVGYADWARENRWPEDNIGVLARQRDKTRAEVLAKIERNPT